MRCMVAITTPVFHAVIMNAMFFLAEAVLLTKNLKASSHKGVLGLFGQHFVKTGVFDKGLGRALNDAYDKR